MVSAIGSGIPTTYASTRFRSRLEARWAAFFDLIGWQWTYEPFDANGYIPDFLIHGDAPFLVEVGPCVTGADYTDKASKPRTLRQQYDVLIVGASPISPFASSWDGELLGLFLGPSDWGMEEGGGQLVRCDGYPDGPAPTPCGRVALFHTLASYQCHPCGHHDGDHNLGGLIPSADLIHTWRRAGNAVQWRRR